MTRFTKNDNDILRKQPWRLLFTPGSITTSDSSSTPSTASHEPHLQASNTVPEEYAQDTFLIKAFFSESEKYYIVMVTNLKQTWYEKLEIDLIRERSKLIRSFAYEEDAQLEALLLSLSTVITGTDSSVSSVSKQASFEFGLATMSWKFKLSPMIISTSNISSSLVRKTAATYSQSSLFPPNLSQLIDDVNAGDSGLGLDTNGNRKRGRRTFLEDSEDEYDDNDEQVFAPDDDVELEYGQRNADGVSTLYDHLILPLIALNNAYRKQTRTLEAVIKNKESEVVETLELLEQHGIGYNNRRRATEKFDKAKIDTKLQEAQKEAEELERRRTLQEQLDKEKAEKEKSRKKKKLF
ncbi:hypothetical protein FBU30_002307 [Linnemannia zychae]|nr:hypothetical protein FBU30_002307 [Linnemannia zychae]